MAARTLIALSLLANVHGIVHGARSGRALPLRARALRCSADKMRPIVVEGIELPLFDPLGDQIPFPFACPAPTNAIDEDDGVPDQPIVVLNWFEELASKLSKAR